jgi:hypothetical protein
MRIATAKTRQALGFAGGGTAALTAMSEWQGFVICRRGVAASRKVDPTGLKAP